MGKTEVRGGQVLDNSIILTPGVGQDVTGILPAANGGTGLSSPGAIDNVLTSDGAGSWLSSPVSGGSVPFFIPSGETFTVPEYKQALWTIPIELDDETSNIDVTGILVEVV